jgi:hypothetical protein
MKKPKTHTLTKDWHFTHINGDQKYDKGMELTEGDGDKWLDERYRKQGFFIAHFYGYGQPEIIPAEFFTPIETLNSK